MHKLEGHYKRSYLCGNMSYTEALSKQIREAQKPLNMKLEGVLFGIFIGVVVTAVLLKIFM